MNCFSIYPISFTSKEVWCSWQLMVPGYANERCAAVNTEERKKWRNSWEIQLLTFILNHVPLLCGNCRSIVYLRRPHQTEVKQLSISNTVFYSSIQRGPNIVLIIELSGLRRAIITCRHIKGQPSISSPVV